MRPKPVGIVRSALPSSSRLIQNKRRRFLLGASLVLLLGGWLVAVSRALRNTGGPLHSDESSTTVDERSASEGLTEEQALLLHYKNDKTGRFLVEYWRRGPVLPKDWIPLEPDSDKEERYVTFEDDAGGWNNIRMAFECFCTAARLLNRTLVLSPKARFYLLDTGPIKTFIKSSSPQTKTFSEYDQFYDFEELKRSGLRVISTNEFLQRKVLADVPNEALESLLKLEHNGFHTKWFLHLRTRADVKMWPSGPVSIPKQFKHLPPPISLRDSLDSHPPFKVIHFPMHMSQGLRFLDGVPALVSSASKEVQTFSKIFVRNHLVYSSSIRESARKAVFGPKLRGALSFACFHIRRNELQYKGSFLAAKASLDNTRALLKPNETVYIATDETERDFFRAFENEGHRVVRLGDVRAEFQGLLPGKLEGMTEQEICSMARVFIGTSTSTFSSFIHRLRMYMWKELVLEAKQVDLRCWFHDLGRISARELDSNPSERRGCPGTARFSRDDPLFSP